LRRFSMRPSMNWPSRIELQSCSGSSRSMSSARSVRLWGSYGAALAILWCRAGGTGGQRRSAARGAKLGSDGSPRRGRRVKGQSRGTAGRVILRASPVTLPSERAMNRVLLSRYQPAAPRRSAKTERSPAIMAD
jgi:hypothetical protein